MKKTTIKSILPCLLLLGIFSCKPTLTVRTDYDRQANFTNYKSFSFYALLANRNVSQFNAERIANAIRTELIKKGYVENNNRPDLMVNAFTVVKNRRSITGNTNYNDYGTVIRPYGVWGGSFGSSQTTFSTYNYKEGSLMIDVVDVSKNRLVWQGTGNAVFDKQPKNPDKAIGEVVTKIMASFPGGNK